MGWLWVEGGLPKKKSRTQQRAYNKNIAFDFEPIHDGHGKTNVRNEMKRCVLKGIEQKECVEKITDKKAAKLRKVRFQNAIDNFRLCSMAASFFFLSGRIVQFKTIQYDDMFDS